MPCADLSPTLLVNPFSRSNEDLHRAAEHTKHRKVGGLPCDKMHGQFSLKALTGAMQKDVGCVEYGGAPKSVGQSSKLEICAGAIPNGALHLLD